MSLSPEQYRERVQDIVAHTLAITTVVGFFSIIFFSLSGNVDLTNQTVSLFVGSAMGYAAAKTEIVLARYFKSEIRTEQDSKKEKPGDVD